MLPGRTRYVKRTMRPRVLDGGAQPRTQASLHPGCSERYRPPLWHHADNGDVLETITWYGAHQEFIVSTQSAGEELRNEGRRGGLQEGLALEAAGALLAVLRVRRVAVPDAVRERILVAKGPSFLERGRERAIVAMSLIPAIDGMARLP